MFSVTINNKNYQLEENLSILEASHKMGLKIPTLCHDPRLKPYGGCRLCIVEVKGLPRPVASCTTPLTDGMVIETHTPEIENYRRTLLELLSSNYPAEKFDQFPNKEFHYYLQAYQIKPVTNGKRNSTQLDTSHPYIQVDMQQCITCYRCVRICDEVQGQFVWKVWNRGDSTRIIPDSGNTLISSTCVSCGACVDTCPTGALENKSILSLSLPTQWTKTTCSYCGTGCEMNVGTRKNLIVTIRPVLESLTSKGHLCVKGRYAYDWVYAKDRITEPMIRENGKWEKVSWEKAISYSSEKLKNIIQKDGRDKIGVIASSRSTNEENYVAQKFTRIVLGTNNVDGCARVCHTPTAAAMKMTLGTGAATNSYNDIEKARTILICGANPTENHPVVGARIKQQVLRGTHLIVIDPRRIELSDYADIYLPIKPGTNIPLLNAMAFVIVEEELYDSEFILNRIKDLDRYRTFIQDYSPEKINSICGIEASLIRKAARLYAMEKPSMCFHGLGVTEHTQGTEGVMCLVNLAFLTGNIGKPGCGVNPLRGQNNVQGCAQMGCDPGILTGSISIKEGKLLFEDIWKAPIPTKSGLNLMEMIDTAIEGDLKALWVIGFDISLTLANSHKTRKALQSLDFIILQDIFLNETAKEFGNVFLPAASPLEKDGTFMSSERRIQRVRQVIDPMGNAKSDWEIICMLADAMGKKEYFHFQSAEEIWNEIRTVWKEADGITYPRIENGGFQWPCPNPDHPGTEILHKDTFSFGEKTSIRCISYTPTPETTNQDYPYMLITGRTLTHFNAGTMTGRTPNQQIQTVDLLDISPKDAEQLNIKNGENVILRSRYGEAKLPIRINSKIKTGELYTTFHNPNVYLNHVTSPYRDRFVKTPEYKVTAVQIKKI